jgi:ABC-2 type transport system permease protein
MSGRRLWAVIAKELRQLRRDRVTMVMIVVIPVVQLVIFGYAINLNVRGLPAGLVDEADTAGSRAVVMDLLATDVVDPVAEARTPHELVDMLRRGTISVGIVVPEDFERRRAEGRPAVQVLVDGSDTAVQAAATQLAQVPVGGATVRPANRGRGEAYSSVPFAPQPVSVVAFYNPQRRSAVNIVPGLIGVILTLTMVLFTAVAVVRERERGHLELLIATPIRRSELMVGKVVPYVAIGLVQTTMILALGRWVFLVPIRGSVLEVYLASGLLIVANLSFGLLISTQARSQMQAMQMTTFVLLPSILISGYLFPFAGMPVLVQWVAELLPMTHFVRLIRGVMLRGASLFELWPDVLALATFAAAMMTLAIARFRKRLD